MFRRVLLAVLCLVPSVASAQFSDLEEVDVGPGLYWRYLMVWEDDFESPVSFTIEGFRDSGIFSRGTIDYRGPSDDGTPVVLPPPIELLATGVDDFEKIDADGDWDIDVDDLNIVRNRFGEATPLELTGDGVMGVDDLNEVRNDFGLKIFSFTPGFEPGNGAPDGWLWLSGEVTEGCVTLLDPRHVANPVVPCAQAMNTPEPSSLLLAGIGIMALSRRIWSRCRQS